MIPELSEGLKRSFLNIEGFGKPLKSPINIRYAFDYTNMQI